MSGTVTTVFVECVSCGTDEVLGTGDVSDFAAVREAHRRGWTVVGRRSAKATRCPDCRRRRRRDTRALDEGRIGNRAGWQTLGRTRA